MKINLDISALADQLEQFKKELTEDIQKSVAGLAKAAHAHIVEDAQKGLHSYREKYLNDLSAPEQLDDTTWCITLNEKSTWIEDGRPEPFDMKPGLLKDGKTSKDGTKYRVVPMNQGKTPGQMSSGNKGYEQNMVNLVKSELKKKGISYKKLELDPATGSPRLGKLHSMNIESFTPGKGSTQQLAGLSIYQTKQKDGSVKRSITTFRTVTEKGQEGKWIHPEVEAKEFFEKAAAWAEQEWESKWLPMILDKHR
jgi:hypothetical protein